MTTQQRKEINLKNGTQFLYHEDTRSLTLRSLFGMTCGFNGKEDDNSRSGLGLICSGSKRFEGNLLHYDYHCGDDVFEFSAADDEHTIRFDGQWDFQPDYEIIFCRYRLTNTSREVLNLRRVLPRWVFSAGDYEVYLQTSRWSAENQGAFQKLNGADLTLKARAARSSVGSTPFCMIRDTESSNGVAFHVLPRGNWVIHIHSDIISNEAPVAVVEAGLSDTDLFLALQPGETLDLPEILLQHAPGGEVRNLAAPLHKYIVRKHLPSDLHLPPVVYNGWLYRFTDFTREQISEQLKAAVKIGCEVFIIDAGWFGYDDPGWGKTGDWREKQGPPFFGNMASFADEVRAAGLKFGFWMEPERWALNIPVREEHPEWFPNHSFRIDLTIPAAAEYFYRSIAENVKKFGAEYIKLDFNLSVGYDESGSELYHYSHTLNVMMLRLRKEFPKLVIENCGSGNLRCDLATSALYDLAFSSDNAHPFETLRIRQGSALRLLPARILNWIVIRPAPERYTKISGNDQVLACAAATWDEATLFNLNFVMLSGLFGVPGFSGDLAAFDPQMLEKIAVYVQFYKENREFFINSHVYLPTAAGPIADYEKFLVFQVQSNDNLSSLLFVFSNSSSRRCVRSFRLQGLEPGRRYRIEKLFPETDEPAECCIKTGAELLQFGLETSLEENMHIRHSAVLYRITQA